MLCAPALLGHNSAAFLSSSYLLRGRAGARSPCSWGVTVCCWRLLDAFSAFASVAPAFVEPLVPLHPDGSDAHAGSFGLGDFGSLLLLPPPSCCSSALIITFHSAYITPIANATRVINARKTVAVMATLNCRPVNIFLCACRPAPPDSRPQRSLKVLMGTLVPSSPSPRRSSSLAATMPGQVAK